MVSILKIKDTNGNIIDIPAIKEVEDKWRF
jgi:hypothetical protein